MVRISFRRKPSGTLSCRAGASAAATDVSRSIAGAAAALSFGARAQQPAMPVVAFINGGSPITSARYADVFRAGLKQSHFVEGENGIVDYEWLEGHYDRVLALVTDLVRRNVAVVVTPGSNAAALAAKSATAKIPIIFGVGGDPVRLGLVASLTQPGGNVTGVNIFNEEVLGKRLRLLHELAPKAVRVGVLVNPTNPATTQTTLREVQKAAPMIEMKIRILNASTSADIDSAFANKHIDALFVAADAFFNSRRVQFAILDTGRVLSGTKPADLPVTAFTKFEFVINAQTARALHIELPPAVLAVADEVIR